MNPHAESRSILLVSLLIALISEVLILSAMGQKPHQFRPLPHPPAPPIEAVLLEQPPDTSHLVEVKKTPAIPAPQPEPILSRTVGVGRVAPAAPANLPETNQTVQSRPQITSHGPILLESPAPKLPADLRNENLKTTVLIEFTVYADGRADPQLIGSSGNDELDALALKSAREWKFTAAIEANQPVAARVRLRINFEVQ